MDDRHAVDDDHDPDELNYSSHGLLAQEKRILVRSRMIYEVRQFRFATFRDDESDFDSDASIQDDSSDPEGDQYGIGGVNARERESDEVLCRAWKDLQKLLRKWKITNKENADVLQFWREHEKRFANNFSLVAKMLLAIPASAAPCERTFSSSGFSDRRASGRSNQIADITYIRKNLHLLGDTPRERIESVLYYLHHVHDFTQEHEATEEDVDCEDESGEEGSYTEESNRSDSNSEL